MENKELEMSQDLGQGQEQEQELEAWSEDEDEEKKPVILSLSLQGLPFKKVNGLVFVDIQSLRNLTTTPGTEQGYQSILDSVNTILNEFNSVNARGYVSLKEHATFLPFLPVVKQFVTSFGLVDSHKSEVSYTWLCNLILFNLYFVCLQMELDLKNRIKLLETELEFGDKVSYLVDKSSDFENLGKKLLQTLDPSIREKLQKRGISVIQNVYTGFDTEYHLKSEEKYLNHLLSVQLAVNTRLIVKLPKYTDFKLAYVHPLTSEVLPVAKNPKLSTIESSINLCIKTIRTLKFNTNDAVVNHIIQTLKKQEGIKYFEDKSSYVFGFPHTEPKTSIYFNDSNLGYSFEEMVRTSNSLSIETLNKSYYAFIGLLKNDFENQTSMVSKETEKLKVESLSSSSSSSSIKTLSRTTYPVPGAGDLISVTRSKNNYFIAHYNSADLSILSDFDLIKGDLDIINKYFVTLGKPFKYADSNVHIRDTSLLAPTGNRSLEAIGSLYGSIFSKISLTSEEKQNMHLLLKRDRKLFQEYAIQDALITLKHSNEMENFGFSSRRIGVPLTLSSLGKTYVLNKWEELNQKGYQISSKYLIGDSSSVQTPKGLMVTKDVGLYMSYYIANYKGGRNESFMYGVDTETLWFDYDLTSAYTTSMANLGDPDYRNLTMKLGSEVNIGDWPVETFIDNYIIVKCSFKFPSETKYPSIPCYIDDNITVYPLEGTGFLTGVEYLLAKNQGCSFIIESVLMIPFSRDAESNTIINKPFFVIIKELQRMRREHPKNSLPNLLLKEYMNSIYGNVTRGMANKKRFDVKTGNHVKMEPSPLSNPILASWTTAFIRSVIGECLHNISEIGGKIVSTTTDGFITNIPHLESKLLELEVNKTPLLRKYRDLRRLLSGDHSGLETKHEGVGVISWTTRGQLGIGSKIKATTGFQARGYDKDKLVELFTNVLKTDKKDIEFTASSLRGANDVYKKGGHVTMIFKDQTFRLLFDNRRRIIEPENFDTFDLSDKLLDSKPLLDIEECRRLRFLSSFHRTTLYNKITSKSRGARYKNTLEIAVRAFIKGLFAEQPLFGLDGYKERFKNYKDLINFIHNYEPCKHISLTPQSLSNLKHRRILIKPVPRTNETEAFVEYVKTELKLFEDQNFFK